MSLRLTPISDGSVKIISREIPQPKAGQVLIKVVVAGTNPKDWKVPYLIPNVPAHNSGDDVAGTVEAVGEGVLGFRKGDRVAAFHEMMSPDGAFAEYCIAWASTTFHIPEKTSYEEAATIPLAAMTAAVGLYLELGLPEPWKADQEKRPLIVYGGSGAVGAFCIKFAQASNIHPIIAVAGKGKDFVEGLLDKSKGDVYVDYRQGDEAVVSGIEKALKDAGCENVKHAYDAVSEHGSYQNISKVLAKNKTGAKMVLVLPGKDYSDIPSNVAHDLSMVGRVHEPFKQDKGAVDYGKKELGARDHFVVNPGKDFGYVFFHYITRGLQEGWFTGHPFEVIPGGLDGVQEGLRRLKAGEASAVKYVYRIAETKDLGKL